MEAEYKQKRLSQFRQSVTVPLIKKLRFVRIL